MLHRSGLPVELCTVPVPGRLVAGLGVLVPSTEVRILPRELNIAVSDPPAVLSQADAAAALAAAQAHPSILRYSPELPHDVHPQTSVVVLGGVLLPHQRVVRLQGRLPELFRPHLGHREPESFGRFHVGGLAALQNGRPRLNAEFPRYPRVVSKSGIQGRYPRRARKGMSSGSLLTTVNRSARRRGCSSRRGTSMRRRPRRGSTQRQDRAVLQALPAKPTRCHA